MKGRYPLELSGPTLEADGVGVTGLLKRLCRAGLLFGVGVKRTERAGLRPTLFFEIHQSCFDIGFRFDSTRFF